MKKVLSRIATLTLAVFVAFGLIIAPATASVHADMFEGSYVKYAKKITLYANPKSDSYYTIKMGKRLKGADSVKVKTSKKKVLAPEYYEGDTDLLVNAKKAGKAKLTITVKKGGKTETYKINVTVEKGKNPFKSFKIGKKNLTSEFKNSAFCNYKVKSSSKQKISIKLQSGMKIKKMLFHYYDPKADSDANKTIKNNSSIKLRGDAAIILNIYDKKSKVTFTYMVYTY